MNFNSVILLVIALAMAKFRWLLIFGLWFTGSFGYLISFFLIGLSIILFTMLRRRIKKQMNMLSWMALSIPIVLIGINIYFNLKVSFIILQNCGWYPCDLGASCP